MLDQDIGLLCCHHVVPVLHELWAGEIVAGVLALIRFHGDQIPYHAHMTELLITYMCALLTGVNDPHCYTHNPTCA